MYILAYLNIVDLTCDHCHINAKLLALLDVDGHTSPSTSNKYLNRWLG